MSRAATMLPPGRASTPISGVDLTCTPVAMKPFAGRHTLIWINGDPRGIRLNNARLQALY